MEREQQGWPTVEGIKPFPNYDAWRIEPLSTTKHLSPEAFRQYIVRYGILAPSSHNKQGWEIDTSEDIAIFPRLSDIGSPSDKKGRQTYIGIGCFVENVRAALSAYDTPASLTIEPVQKTHIARFFLPTRGNELVDPEILAAIKARSSYRGMFEDYQIDARLMQAFDNAASSGIIVKLITDRTSRTRLAELQAEANRVALFRKDFRNELAQYLVSNDFQEARVMPGDTFGLSDESAHRVHEALASSGQFDSDLAAGFARADRDAMVSASAIGIIAVIHDTPEQWITVGMTLEHIWLIAKQHDLDMAVSAGMIESEIHNVRLKQQLGLTNEKPAIVFRIGKARETRPHSPRASLSDVLIES